LPQSDETGESHEESPIIPVKDYSYRGNCL
jgi:hypothetical protein